MYLEVKNGVIKIKLPDSSGFVSTFFLLFELSQDTNNFSHIEIHTIGSLSHLHFIFVILSIFAIFVVYE